MSAHYRVKIPKDAKGPITFTAKLNHRKFAHYYTQFAYAGEPKPGQDPSLVGKAYNSLEYSFDTANIPANVSGQIKDRDPESADRHRRARRPRRFALGDGKTPTSGSRCPQGRPRALERLGHRPAAAGRSERRRYAFTTGDAKPSPNTPTAG